MVVQRQADSIWRNLASRGNVLTSIPFSVLDGRLMARMFDALSLDVIEMCDFQNEGAFANSYSRAPTIIRLHTTRRRDNTSVSLRSQLRRRVARAVEKHYFSCSAMLSAPSTQAANEARADFGPGLNIQVIPNCIDTEFWAMPETNSRDEQLLLYAGRFEHRKGLDRLPAVLESVFTRISTARIIFAATDYKTKQYPEGMESWLKKQLPSRFIERLIFLGPQQRNELRRLYHASSVLLVPSRAEPFGLVACEAMACGCIPVVQQGTGLVDVVGKEMNSQLIVDFDQPNAAAESILAILSGGSQVSTLRLRGRLRAEAHFSQRPFAEAWTRAAKNLL